MRSRLKENNPGCGINYDLRYRKKKLQSCSWLGSSLFIVCFISITNLQIAGHPGGGVIKSVISYTQFANKLRMAVKAHAAGINKIHALRSNRHHMD